jgi:hypothetical protein
LTQKKCYLVSFQIFKEITLGCDILTSVSDFINNEGEHERILAEYMNWEYVDFQQKGFAYDFIAPDGSKIEAKFDWGSIKTGNHYLEFAQTCDNRITWVPSGFSISADQAKFWVVINEDWIRIFQIEVLRDFMQKYRSSLIIKETRSGVNYNQPGQYSKAYIIPFILLDVACMAKFPNPIQRQKK